ncbi:MAG: SDR family oxidoreductase [Acidobacteria bacterium]|nr:SDR family oxidoreductase [Acidobacteriota bacterium]
MSVVAVTGIAGYLGQRLLRLLEADPGVERIVGVDIGEPAHVSPRLEFHQMDVRDVRLGKALAGAGVLVHLAFVLNPIRDEERMGSINVEGSRNAFEAAASAGVEKIVYASSAVVYGAHPDNDFPLTEESPLRANSDFPYAAHKLEVERWIETFRERRREIVVTVLRPATVFGPGVDNFMSRQFEAPRLLTVGGYRPPLQLVHEEDVASALELAVRADLPGAYNVSADGWLSRAEALSLLGKKQVELPEAVAFEIAERLWRLGLTLSPAAELHYTMHPWVLDNSKLKAAGWRPRHGNRETLLEAYETLRPWVSLGAMRARREDLVRGAAATLGVVSAAALLRRARRRRA